jgi:preprotein translocase subunit SecE
MRARLRSGAFEAKKRFMADKLKIALAALLVVAGLVGFYWFSSQPAVLRVLMVLGGIAAGVAVGWFSAPGQELVAFTRDAINEVKKMVWPTRKESFQTAAAVFGFVVVMALFLWIVDKGLEWAMYDLILGWKKS